MTEFDPNRITANNMLHRIMGRMGIISAIIFNTIYNRHFDMINDVIADQLHRHEKMILQQVADGCYEEEIATIKNRPSSIHSISKNWVPAITIE